MDKELAKIIIHYRRIDRGGDFSKRHWKYLYDEIVVWSDGKKDNTSTDSVEVCKKCNGTGIYFYSDRVPEDCECKNKQT